MSEMSFVDVQLELCSETRVQLCLKSELSYCDRPTLLGVLTDKSSSRIKSESLWSTLYIKYGAFESERSNVCHAGVLFLKYGI